MNEPRLECLDVGGGSNCADLMVATSLGSMTHSVVTSAGSSLQDAQESVRNETFSTFHIKNLRIPSFWSRWYISGLFLYLVVGTNVVSGLQQSRVFPIAKFVQIAIYLLFITIQYYQNILGINEERACWVCSGTGRKMITPSEEFPDGSD